MTQSDEMIQPDYIIPLTSYDDNGRIISNHTVPQSMRDIQVGNFLDGHFDSATHYVVGGQAVPRPPCPAVLDGLAFNGMPASSTLVVNGQSFEVTEATVELTFSKPGQYNLRIVCWPYLDGNFSVRI